MASDLAQLTASLQQKVAAYVPNNYEVRQGLIDSARKLIYALETPEERVSRMTNCEPYVFSATRTLIDLKIFKILAESDSPKSVAELAKTCGADENLLGRLIKHVACEEFVTETAADEYKANDMTRALASPGGEGAVVDVYNIFSAAAAMPAFLKETNYANPIDKDKSMFKYANKTNLHYFEWLWQPGNEEMVTAFKNNMAWRNTGNKWYNDKNVMAGIFGGEKFEKEDVVMIDIGGNSGHDLLGFHKAHPEIPGRFILQDLPGIVDSLDSADLKSQCVEAMAHDMFTPEPIQGAKVYYSRQVLHDWPAEQCKQALSNIKPALKPGYSRILLNEFVVPAVNAHWSETGVDMLMMAAHSARERKETEWREIVDGVEGLRIKKIWHIEDSIEKIIEIEAV